MAERVKSARSRIDVEREETEDLITEMEGWLRIDKNGLDDALEQQPDLYYRVSKALTLENSRRDALKQEIAEVEAEADASIREDAANEKEKLTETEVKMMARLFPKLRGLNKELVRMNRRCGELDALKSAFNQRSYAIKELVSLYVAAYFGDHVGKGSAGSSGIKDRDAAIARRGMAEARRSRHRED